MRITVKQLRTLIREAVQEINPNLQPDCDTFAVFDFDETLALTNSEILVVDDEDDIRSLIADILEDEGYRCRTASDSEGALAAISEKRTDLLILDIFKEFDQVIEKILASQAAAAARDSSKPAKTLEISKEALMSLT